MVKKTTLTMNINHQHKIETSNKKLLSYDELPDYMKDNEFILNYYRAKWPLKHAMLSLFQWHNETLNIWTHLLGFALFVGLTFVNVMHVSEGVHLFGIFRDYSIYKVSQTNICNDYSSKLFTDMTNMVDNMNHTRSRSHEVVTPHLAIWPFYVYLSGSMFCLLSSTICHLFCCHSQPIYLWLVRLDYIGITIMIITSFFPPIYYIFLCQPLFQILYLTFISLFGAFTIVTLLSPALYSAKFRAYRAILFASMGLFGLVPAIHGSVLNWTNPRRNLSLAYEFAMGLCYLIGTGFYVGRVPERWRPGWFDLAGQSHQIFHVFVVLGALAHYGATLVIMQFRVTTPCL